ncbi:MAG: PIN domain-containing protein [Chitinophagales bacterium]|nr:nucleotide-binding protein [Bacteroidota bacterium]
MKIIVDANIVFSAILNTNGKIADLLINSTNVKFIAPDFLRLEIRKYHNKLAKTKKISSSNIQEIEYFIFQNIVFISEIQIEEKYWKQAYELLKDIDEKDTPYITYALKFKCKLWTGDKKLVNGLKKKNRSLTISTNELYELLN